jgi:hypothetical protein
MKTFPLILVLAALTAFRAVAQVDLDVTTEQEQFLPGEALPVAVKIVNSSGQRVRLGTAPDWLTFDVESAEKLVVVKDGMVPVLGEFELESGQLGIKRADLQPYFYISKPGRYKIIATLRIADWSVSKSSPAKYIDVINGVDLWTQDVGLPPVAGATNSAPEVRKYTLVEANYLRSQLRLYVRVADVAANRIVKLAPLGALVSFSHPEAQVDRLSRLHVLWQTGSKAFTHCLINPDGVIAQRETYDYFTSRPRLGVNANGEVIVAGGTRRAAPTEYPAVKSPMELPATPVVPAKPNS